MFCAVLDWDRCYEVGIVDVENVEVRMSPVGRDEETAGLIGED